MVTLIEELDCVAVCSCSDCSNQGFLCLFRMEKTVRVVGLFLVVVVFQDSGYDLFQKTKGKVKATLVSNRHLDC